MSGCDMLLHSDNCGFYRSRERAHSLAQCIHVNRRICSHSAGSRTRDRHMDCQHNRPYLHGIVSWLIFMFLMVYLNTIVTQIEVA